MKTCIINVGVNSSHGSLRSPIFPDGRFEFVPIPDETMLYAKCGNSVYYRDLKTYTEMSPSDFIPSRYLDMPMHADPEFHGYTYGDYPEENPRAFNLTKLDKGDKILFYARLVSWSEGRFQKHAGFYFIGHLDMIKLYSAINDRPSDFVLRKIKTNAHVIRGQCDEVFYNNFWVFKGSKTNSLRYKIAVPFDKEFIDGCGIHDARGNQIKWHQFPSELSTIGAYFRTARLITEEDQHTALWNWIESRSM